MNRTIKIALVCAGIAMPLLAAPSICKLCGAKYPDEKTLLRNTCPHNHGGKHVLFEGPAAP